MNAIILDSNWQLFIDDYVLARTTGLDRVIHHPRPMGLVIQADRPWETAGAVLTHVQRREGGSFEGYCQATWWDPSLSKQTQDVAHHMRSAVGLVTSTDGINWDKPDLGLIDAPADVDWSNAPFPAPKGTTRENNLGVPFVVVADLGRFGNVSDPSKCYALRIVSQTPCCVASSWELSPRGYFAGELPDFINDPQWCQKLTDSGGSFDPRRHMLSFWDDIHDQWVAIEQGVVGRWLPSREIARFSSPDLVNWMAEAVLYPDADDSHTSDRYDEPMSLTPFCAEGVVVGLLSWFHSDRTCGDGGPTLIPDEKHPQRWPWCRKGTCEMRITVSRDGGKTWSRSSSRGPWIPHGTEQDSYNRMVIGSLPPVRVGQEDWFYTTVYDGDHLTIRNNPDQGAYYRDRLRKAQTALYVQKHNRYVSMTVHTCKGVLITKPLIYNGGALQLNADAGRGEVRVGIASGEPTNTYDGTTPSIAPHLLVENFLDGFGFDDCEPIRANSTELPVRFKNQNLESLRGRTICLLLEIVNADLYGFRVV